jgi:PAS domain S-box-containing protein
MEFLFFDDAGKKPYLIPALIIISSLVFLILIVFGIERGFTYVLPHLLYIPIILAAYYYPRRGVPFAIGLSICYAIISFTVVTPTTVEMFSAIARCAVFIAIAAVVSNLSARMHHDTQMCRRLVSVVKSSGDAIVGETPEGVITDWNSGAEHLYGYGSREMVGSSVFLLIPPDRQREGLQFLKRIREGETISCDTERIKKDGTRIQVTLTLSPILNIADEIVGISSVTHDITDRKHAETALELASRKMSLLSSITRHDILNQLSALKSYIELSREISDPQALGKYIGTEEKIVETLERQINFTREYQDLGVTAPVWQNVSAIIEKSTAALPMRNVVVEQDCTGIEVFADLLFEKVFYNLIDNALKYGGEKMTVIRISSHETDKQLTLVCEDDGEGISLEDKRRLFTQGFGKHTGLGLFLSREILAITGITITENGEPGKGVRFEILVPKGKYRPANPN